MGGQKRGAMLQIVEKEDKLWISFMLLGFLRLLQTVTTRVQKVIQTHFFAIF